MYVCVLRRGGQSYTHVKTACVVYFSLVPMSSQLSVLAATYIAGIFPCAQALVLKASLSYLGDHIFPPCDIRPPQLQS